MAERRSLSHRILLSALLLMPLAATAQVPQTLEEADAQRARASTMRKEAETRHVAEQNECYKKFLVNRCLDEAKKRYTQTIIDARNLDAPARDFQRDVKRAEVEAKEAKRAAELPKREADQKMKGKQYRADEAERAQMREKHLTDKDEQAAKYRQKSAADEARRQEKAAKRASKDAERARKKEKQAAKEAAEAEAKAGAAKP